MNLRGRRLDWAPHGARHKFLTGKTNNPTGPLAGEYANAYSSLLKGDGNDPFTMLFQKQLGPVLAQAKESAGNLTGSSFGNIAGSAAGRSLSQFLLGILGQGSNFAAPGTQQTHTPGFLDYLFAGLTQGASIMPGGKGAGNAGPLSSGAISAGDFPSFA